MLTAGSAGTIGINPQIILIDLHIQILLNIRHHVAGYKGGLPLSVGVERRDPHQAVDASLGFQISKGVLPVDLEGH